jgi:putative cell wall-binding protein
LDPAVDQALAGLGYKTVRLQGADRYQTALAVAQALGNPGTILLATGTDFPDALSGGPAAAKASGAVLLTNGSGMDPTTAAYLSGHPGDKVFALGGPAAAADPAATAIVGADRYATAVLVAQRFFPGVTTVGTASGANFPDALAGGAAVAELGGPMLLTDPASPSSALTAYLAANSTTIQRVLVFGGAGAVSDVVLTTIDSVLG